MRPQGSRPQLPALILTALLASACSQDKVLDPGLDYGPEDAASAGKDDSATYPASMGRLRDGIAQRTSFTATSRWRAFTFSASAGQAVSIYVDGLRELDTVAYVYNLSASTGRPYGRAVASNDDTEVEGWTDNAQSSSVVGFVPRYSRDYALVVTTYRQSGRGSATVVARSAAPAPAAFDAGGSGVFVDLEGVRAEVMKTSAESDALASSVHELCPTFTGAFHVAPATLKSLVLAAPTGPAVVGSAFGNALDMSDWLGADNVAVSPTPAATLGETLADHLVGTHLGGNADDPRFAPLRAAYRQLAASMRADGVTHSFLATMEDSGDYSYGAVVTINVDRGDIRMFGFRLDP